MFFPVKKPVIRSKTRFFGKLCENAEKSLHYVYGKSLKSTPSIFSDRLGWKPFPKPPRNGPEGQMETEKSWALSNLKIQC